jgi:hypothetical protein
MEARGKDRKPRAVPPFVKSPQDISWRRAAGIQAELRHRPNVEAWDSHVDAVRCRYGAATLRQRSLCERWGVKHD